MDIISVYDSTLYKIVTGHLVAKVSCIDQSQSKVQFLIGAAPNLQVINLEHVVSIILAIYVCMM